MLSIRLQRAQVDLQAHRTWLNTFIATRHASVKRATVASSASRSFATSAWPGKHQRQAGKRRATLGSARDPWQQTKKKSQASPSDNLSLEVLSARDSLIKAVEAYDIKAVVALYSSLPIKKPLGPKDVGALAQCVHQCVRQELYKSAATRRREDLDDIVVFAKHLVSDIEKERLLPNILAHIHLLGVFKESGTRDAGIAFWQWLENQDDDHVNLDVYAVAIDLLAINGSSLDELEEMYQNALSRFPGTFFAYHLSPGAIIPDREQEFSIKGLPMSLLQCITFARLLRGDSRKAYLALDTAFRLYPASVPQRFFNIFQDERPVSESYTVFAMACRAGIQIPSGQFRGLLAKLRTCSNMGSVTSHIVTLRVMLAAIYLQLGSSGTLTSNSISELIITLTQVFRLPGVDGMDKKERKKLIDAVLVTIRKIMAVFVRYGALPTISAFNSVITNVAGYGRAKEVLGIATADIKVLDLEPDDITRRSLLTAAGLLRDSTLVNKFWKDIEDARADQKSVPHGIDIHILIKAARLTGQDDLAKSTWDTYKQHVDTKHTASIESRLSQPLGELEPSRSADDTSAHYILEGVEALQSDLTFVDEQTKDRPAIQDFSNQDLPITLLPVESYWDVPEVEMRSIYDYFTTEPLPAATMRPSVPQDDDAYLKQAEGLSDLSRLDIKPDSTRSSTAPSPTPKFSVTNISFGQLRYQNWKIFNYLLRLAEQHDQGYEKVVDQAIAAGKKPPTRNMGFTVNEVEAMRNFGLSRNSENGRSDRNDVDTERSADAKAQVMRLRNLGP